MDRFSGLDISDDQFTAEWKEGRRKATFEQYRTMLLADLMKNQEAKIFLGMIIISSGFLTNSHINSNTKQEPEPNAMQMSFNEGRRFMGEMVYSLLDGLDPDSEFPFECMRAYRKWLHAIDVATNVALRREEDNYM